jgi:hypothetical protein
MTLNRSVFISYSRSDKPLAEALEKELRDAGKLVWTDKELRAGEDWDLEIQNALKNASFVVIIVSAALFDSQWANYEIGSAIAAGTPVIPVLVGDVTYLPKHLRQLQTVDARGLDAASVGAKVTEALDRIQAQRDNR